MNLLSDLVWTGEAGPARIIVTLLAGGVLIALMQWRDRRQTTLESMLKEELDPIKAHRRRSLRLAALGILAVGFGGAVGPKPGSSP